MPHQCVHCSKIITPDSKEILEGCASCGGRFFFYIREEMLKKIEEQNKIPMELIGMDKEKVEKDVREILKIEDDEEPVVLDLESVKVINDGKFELDLVSLFNRKPIVFKLEEGKYIIDLESAMPKKI